MSNSGRVMAFTVETSGGAATEMPNYLLQAQPNIDHERQRQLGGEAGRAACWHCARTGVSRQSKVLEIEDHWRDVDAVDFDRRSPPSSGWRLWRRVAYTCGFDEGVQVAR